MNQDSVYSQKRIYVYTFDRKLFLTTSQRTDKIYAVAVGKAQTPTPHGTYQIINKIINPGGILGSRWMGLNIPNGPYGIHGTSRPESIGKAISNGCIRMYNHDIEEIFNKISIGTTVIIQPFSEET
ncbi:L,D-transpeptidase [Phosphitispora sp. TUW77]|uniref:L,D-transpeptidase n=1 Tax=Phosphitispora sp. TUW77 TaxID=3152361 RepID=UPI003AB378E7